MTTSPAEITTVRAQSLILTGDALSVDLDEDIRVAGLVLGRKSAERAASL